MQLPDQIPAHNEAQWDQLMALKEANGLRLIGTDTLMTRDSVLESLVNNWEEDRHVVLDLKIREVPALFEMLKERLPEDVIAGERAGQVIHIINWESSWFADLEKEAPEIPTSLSAEALALTDELPFPLLWWTHPHMEAWLTHHQAELREKLLGSFHFFSSDTEELIASPQEQIPVLQEQLGSSEGEAKASQLIDLAEIWLHFRLWEKAQEHLEEAETLLEGSENQELIGNNQAKLADCLAFQGQLMEAVPYFEEAVEAFEAVGETKVLAEVLEKMGAIYGESGQWKEAIPRLVQARDLYGEQENQNKVAGLSQQLARIFERKGNLEKAVASHQQAADAFEALDMPDQITKSYQQIGAIRQNNLEFDLALQAFQSALPFAEKAEDDFLLAAVEDSIENMEQALKKGQAKAKGGEKKKGFFGKLFG
ncbi:MAG: tetratricopeptide repeat protein [Bacteroidota bacterium]